MDNVDIYGMEMNRTEYARLIEFGNLINSIWVPESVIDDEGITDMAGGQLFVIKEWFALENGLI